MFAGFETVVDTVNASGTPSFERAPHARIGELRPRGVELQAPQVGDQPLRHAEPRQPGQLVDLRLADAVVDVDVVRLQERVERIGAWDDAVRDAVESGLPAPVQRVRYELERRAVVPSGQHERSARDRPAVERGVVEIGELRQQVGRERRIAAAAAGEDAQNPAVRLLQVHHDRVRVGEVHRRDVVPAGRDPRVVAFVQHRFPGEDEIAAVVRRTVRPLHPAPDVQRDGVLVFRDPAVRQRRHLGRSRREVLAGGPVAEQRLRDELRDLIGCVGVREQLVQRVRLFAGRTDHQVTGPRPRVAAAGGRHPWTRPGHLVIGSAGEEPDSLNKLFANTDAADQIAQFISEPLFRYGPAGEYLPAAATEVPTLANGGIAKDQHTVTLHIRRGMKWSDGAPYDGRDLVFTWKAVLNKRNNTRITAGWDDIAAMDLPDPYTVVVHLKKPYGGILGIFACGGGGYPPLPAHLLAQLPDLDHAAFNSRPISSGPFVLTAWNHGSSLEFVANPLYWRGKPGLDRISYRIVPSADTLYTLLQTHDVDIYDSVSESKIDQLPRLAGFSVTKRLIANLRRLQFNTARPQLAD